MSTRDLPVQVAQPPAFQPERRRHEIARVLRRRRRLRAGIVQLLYAVTGAVLGILVPKISGGFRIPSGRAVEMLVAVGAGTVTFIGVVFSLLFLVAQFGSTTFTPRLNLFRDARIVWHAFALYTAVIVYSFIAALVIGRTEETSGFVPIVAIGGVLVSIGVYRALQMGAFKSIQLASTLAQVVGRGRVVLDGLYTQQAGGANEVSRSDQEAERSATREPRHEIRWPRRSAILQVIDVPRVVSAAERADARVEFSVGSGETIPEDAVVATVRGPAGAELEREVLRALTVGEERTFEQDPALALRVLADIALRALSPAINDPTTAVQALDALDSLLRVLARRELDIGRVPAADGVTRVVLVLPSWMDYLDVSLEELIRLPHQSVAVSRRIAKLLDDLAAICPPDRRPELESRRGQLDRVARS